MKPLTLDAAQLERAARLLARRDERLAHVYRQLGPPPLWKRPATFATLVRIILEQQVSLASAARTYERLAAECGGKVQAKDVERFSADQLRAIGFSRQKARYTLALAEDVASGRFRIARLRRLPDDHVRQQIIARLGLGQWSADVFLLMALARQDVFPVGDLAVIQGMQHLDGISYASPEDAVERAEQWKPYRSVATRMLWQWYLAGNKTPLKTR